MAKLNIKLTPDQQKLLFGSVVGLIGGGYAYIAFYWMPISAKIVDTGKQIEDVEKKIDEADKRAKQLHTLYEELVGLNEQADQAEKELPNEKAVADIFVSINDLAKDYDLSLQSFGAGKLTTQPFFSELSYAVTVKGTFHNIGKFLAKVSLETRIFNVKDVRYTEPDGSGQMPVTFTLLSYKYDKSAARAEVTEDLGPGLPPSDEAEQKAEARAFKALHDLSAPASHQWKMVTCGTTLWNKKLKPQDGALAEVGEPADFVVPAAAVAGKPKPPPAPVGRSFSPAHNISAFYQSLAVQNVARSFAKGTARPATQGERNDFYKLALFEIKSKPIVIIENGKDSLVYYTDPANPNEILWLDLLPKASNAPPAEVEPPPTVVSIYSVDSLRDPFAKTDFHPPATPLPPGEIDLNNLNLTGLMGDKAGDFAVFTDNTDGRSFVLRRGKLYDAKSLLKPAPRAVRGVTGSLNIRQRTAHLANASAEKDFGLGDASEVKN
jgi:Tfp pilus assembly protein PilO